MTLAVGFSCSAGGLLVSDRRVVDGGASIVSDTFSKQFVLAGGRYGVVIAGDIGPAQTWMRACRRVPDKKLASVDALMSEHCGGDFSFVVYDASVGKLYNGDGQGCLIECAPDSWYAIGCGAEYLRGYLAGAHGVDATFDSLAEAETAFCEAIKLCARQSVGVSPEADCLRFERVAKRRAARKPAARRSRKS